MSDYNPSTLGGGPPGYNTGSSKLLNGLPSDYEMALQQQRANGFDGNAYDFQNDLDMFTNTQFFDFDMAEVPELNTPNNGLESESWNLGSGFNQSQQSLQPIQPYTSYNGPSKPHQHSYPLYPTATASSTPTTASPNNGLDPKSRNSSDPSKATSALPVTLEEASQEAAEEDKRRRNTAASARFRVKKKQREQALEKSAKDMTERVTYLENRLQTLEMENKLLKDLLTEKSGVAPNIGEKDVEEALGERREAAPAKRKEVKIETKAAS